MSPTTLSGANGAEGSAPELIDTSTELLFHVSPDAILAEARSGDVRAAVSRLLARQGLTATPLAIDDTVDRLAGKVEAIPE